MAIEIETLALPDHWASALINGDTSGMTDEDELALDLFTEHMVEMYGQCHAMTCSDEHDEESPGFLTYHDARDFGVLACNCLAYTFDITQRG